MPLLILTMSLFWPYNQISDDVAIERIWLEESVLILDIKIINRNDFAICIPRHQLPIDFMQDPILVIKKDGNTLYYQQGISLIEYPMWVALPPNYETATSFSVDTSFYDGATGEVSGYVQVAGLPCDQAMAEPIASAPLPHYYGVIDQEREKEIELAMGYIFIRSDEFNLVLP